MDNETLFYVAGIALAVSAVLVTLVALRLEKFPGRAAPLVALWFIVLVGSTTTFAVLHAKDEKEHEEPALAEAGHEAEAEEAEVITEDGGSGGSGSKGGEPEAVAPRAKAEQSAPKEKASSSTLKLAADPTAIAFDTTSLESTAGEVTIDFSNPSSVEHNVAIEQGSKEIATSPTISQGDTSVTAELTPGTYTFLCTVPGHAEAGMQGTLTVK